MSFIHPHNIGVPNPARFKPRSAPVMTDQYVTFGRKTLVGDGLASFDNGSMVTESGKATTLSLGTRTVGSDHFSVSGNGIQPSTIPADAQYVWTGCTVDDELSNTSNTFTLTVNTVANAYSIVSDSDATNAVSDAGGAPTTDLMLIQGNTSISTIVNIVKPVIAGFSSGADAVEDDILTCTLGEWIYSEKTTHYVYQWKRDGVKIDDATQTYYVVVAADVGTAITCEVTVYRSKAPYNFFEVDDTVIAELGELTFPIYRGYARGTSVVQYEIVGDTAIEGTDYDATIDGYTGTVTFTDEQQVAWVRINTLDGTDGQRKCFIKLHGPTNGTIKKRKATGYINDATCWFVSTADGAWGAAGTKAAPKSSWREVMRDSQWEAEDTPGMTVLFKRGETYEVGNLATYAWGGSNEERWRGVIMDGLDETKRVVVGAYGEGADPIIDSVTNENMPIMRIQSDTEFDTDHFLNFQNLRFTTSRLPSATDGEDGRPALAFEMRQQTNGGGGSTGLRWGGVSATGYWPGKVNFIGCEFDGWIDCINGETCRNVWLKGCRFHDNYPIAPETFSNNDAIFWQNMGGGAKHCWFYENGNVIGSSDTHDWHKYSYFSNSLTLAYNKYSHGPNGTKVRMGWGVHVLGCEFKFHTRVGLNMGPDTGDSLFDVMVEDCLFNGAGIIVQPQTGNPITAYLTNLRIRNNSFVDIESSVVESLVLEEEGPVSGAGIHGNLFVTWVDGGAGNSINIKGDQNTSGQPIRIEHNDFVNYGDNNTIGLIQLADVSNVSTITTGSNNFQLNSDGMYRVNNVAYDSLTALQATYPTLEIGSDDAATGLMGTPVAATSQSITVV